MKTMGWRVSALAGGALLGAVIAAAPAGTSAQQSTPESSRTDCRCVDHTGKSIPNCTCLQTYAPGDFVVSGFGQPAAHARLGISVSVRQDAADDAEGARVQSVLKNGPADSAGIRRGDIITSLDGKSLSAKLDPTVEKDFDKNESLPVQRLLSIASDLDPDVGVPVRYLRDGKEHQVTVTTRNLSTWVGNSTMPPLSLEVFRDRMHDLRERLDSLGRDQRDWRVFRSPGHRGSLRIFSDSVGPSRLFLRTPSGSVFRLRSRDTLDPAMWRCPGDDGHMGFLEGGDECVGGLRLIKLNPGLASYFKTDKGVLVSDVEPSSSTGLQPGDVILEIGGRDADNPDRARRILASYSASEKIDFRIVRKGKTMDVKGHLGG